MLEVDNRGTGNRGRTFEAPLYRRMGSVEVADQVAVTNNNFYKLTEKYNKVCGDMENVLAENKILRKLHGIP